MSLLSCNTPTLRYTKIQAWLGFYNGQLRRVGWTKEDLVAAANFWITTVCRQQEVPGLQTKTLGKMGLRGVRIRLILVEIDTGYYYWWSFVDGVPPLVFLSFLFGHAGQLSDA